LDELTQRLGSLLNDPEALKQAADMARSILEPGPEQKSENASAPDLGRLLGLAAPLQAGRESVSLAALRAVAPCLSPERGRRLERAVRLSGMAGAALRLLREYGGESLGDE